MRANEANGFSHRHPETFTWGHLDSPKIASIASAIVADIEHNMHTANRDLVPGLRQALNRIAEIAEI